MAPLICHIVSSGQGSYFNKAIYIFKSISLSEQSVLSEYPDALTTAERHAI